MVHSVEFLFDDDTDAAVRQIWDDLAEAGVRSQAAHKSPSNAPHVTVTVAQQMDDEVSADLREVLPALPMDCEIGAPMLFGGRAMTLARLIVPSLELLTVQAEIYRICLPHMATGPLPHTRPGSWTPHVTLARRLTPDALAQALTVPELARDFRGRITGLRHWDGDAKVVHPVG